MLYKNDTGFIIALIPGRVSIKILGFFPITFMIEKNVKIIPVNFNNFLGNSMSKNPGQVIFNSWTFLKKLPVVGIKETWISWKYQSLTPSGSDSMAFGKFYQNLSEKKKHVAL